MTTTLEKAELICLDGAAYNIVFMFNPNQLSISKKTQVNDNKGSRTEKGLTKVSFAHPNPTIISIKDVILDVYESKDRDLSKEIIQLTKSLKFVPSQSQDQGRPPIYIFGWGDVNYMRCYVESLEYQITMFRPNGTPVRAKFSLSLKEIDPSFGTPNPPPNPSLARRNTNTRWGEE